MRRFTTNHVPAVGEFVLMDQEVSHHILRVTGIAPGERVELFDGSGLCAVAELCGVQDGLAQLRVISHVDTLIAGPTVHLMLAQLRANSLDTVLRMVTELGVSHITIVQSERCVARGDKRERWTRIVRSAAAQSGRSGWPTIHEPRTFEQALVLPSGFSGVMCDPQSSESLGRSTSDVCVLIGPEGGWTDQERAQASAAGWALLGLGQSVLRADTAAVAAVTRCLS